MITDSTLSNDPLALASIPVYRFTVEEYRRLGEAGILNEGHGVELLEGWIVRKMNLNPPHSVSVKLCDSFVQRVLPAGWHTRVQDAIQTSDSEPEPDLAIVRGAIRDYAHRHPTAGDLALLIEVADSSLPRDRYKCKIYGKAGIPVYWIVNLVDRRVEVYSEPTGPDTNPGYRRRDDFGPHDEVPVLVDGREIARVVASELLA
ncbi:MAG TPA: Uma2 family endonuclease [Pirellulaceae bacterium]|nr:Uma2 family endonuclease [Pirellulaceae bacterium]